MAAKTRQWWKRVQDIDEKKDIENRKEKKMTTRNWRREGLMAKKTMEIQYLFLLYNRVHTGMEYCSGKSNSYLLVILIPISFNPFFNSTSVTSPLLSLSNLKVPKCFKKTVSKQTVKQQKQASCKWIFFTPPLDLGCFTILTRNVVQNFIKKCHQYILQL